MTNNVIILPLVTKLDIPPARVLEAALVKDLRTVIIIGYDQNGEHYFASSVADGGTVMWMIETAKLRLLQAGGVLSDGVVSSD